MVYQLAQVLGIEVAQLLDPSTPYDLEYLQVRRGMRQADVVDAGLGVSRAFYGRVERGLASLAETSTARAWRRSWTSIPLTCRWLSPVVAPSRR
ncbi:hypothetical protein [Micromonospora aurantiaca (nom. illeg.)]|uniref:hypothetical protein n=1 Tax=Micromonospora aurantiaca (nom. illeg.) TaxID=47850 RepID=UPI0033C196FA